MPQIILDMNLEEIKEIIRQLSPQELMEVADAIEERTETVGMMSLAEASFAEWGEEGEDIYGIEIRRSI